MITSRITVMSVTFLNQVGKLRHGKRVTSSTWFVFDFTVVPPSPPPPLLFFLAPTPAPTTRYCLRNRNRNRRRHLRADRGSELLRGDGGCVRGVAHGATHLCDPRTPRQGSAEQEEPEGCRGFRSGGGLERGNGCVFGKGREGGGGRGGLYPL